MGQQRPLVGRAEASPWIAPHQEDRVPPLEPALRGPPWPTAEWKKCPLAIPPTSHLLLCVCFLVTPSGSEFFQVEQPIQKALSRKSYLLYYYEKFSSVSLNRNLVPQKEVTLYCDFLALYKPTAKHVYPGL